MKAPAPPARRGAAARDLHSPRRNAEERALSRIVFRNALLLDGHRAAQADSTVVLEGERIARVAAAGERVALEPDDRIVDLAGRALMPGMFSCHFHASFDGATLDVFPLGIDKPPGYLMLRAAAMAKRALDAGFTSVVGAGGGDDLDAQLALAIADGLVQGPRITPASRNLGTRGGYIDLANWWWKLGNEGACRLGDGAEAFREIVRDELRRGAEIVKVFATGGHGNVHSAVREFSHEELAMIARTAHERGKKVRAHCAWRGRILECVELDYDLIDHADEMDAQCIDAMRKRGTFVAPSMLYLDRLLGNEELRRTAPPELVAAGEHELENLMRRVPEANRAGVRMVLGDDFGTVLMPHGSYGEELAYYVKRVGIAPLDVLRWATVHGAALAGVADRLGSVEAGKLADLLVVSGDPSVDITLLADAKNLHAIVKGGVFVKDLLSEESR